MNWWLGTGGTGPVSWPRKKPCLSLSETWTMMLPLSSWWTATYNVKACSPAKGPLLTEHHLLDYTELEEKAVAATAHHNELSAQIKATEKRMAEIAVLRTHIVNYAKTRETYVAYRKAGYSRKFREEHEQEILLHQAAKN